ncbi:MAG: type II toxin-antitoxin system PemK/MazF family toxin [Ruminococcus sp.]|nr:type II toxin-antitoxin system PemK/MazF family toxin [Ruminococcus sp.]
MLIKRGDLFYADLNPVIGSEQGGIRPVLVVQNNVGNMHSPTIVVLPITSSNKPSLPVHAKVDDNDLLTDGSIALAEQIRTIDKRRLRSYIGSLDSDAMKRVDEIIKISLEVS